MKTNVDYKGYDTLIQPTDWRYSAACLGLHRFLTYSGFDFMLLNDCEDTVDGAIYGFDGILYHSSDLTEENYLLFAENFFKKDMTHLTILSMLENAEFTKENIKKVNGLIKSKKVFENTLGKNTKFDGTNKDVISNLINENRFEIIKSIFRYGKNLYSNYCKENLLLTDSNNHCRLAGYTVDEDRKSNSLGFCFSKESVDCNDEIEFDFIPFAFSNPEMYETYFVNNNYSIKELVKTNDTLSERLRDNEKKNPKTRLLSVLQQADNFINYDVEIIEKNRDKNYYSTLFVRTERLRALKQLSDKSLSFTYKIAEDYWLNLEKEVFERCLNNVLLDDLIERMLKISLDSGEVNKTTVRFRTNTLVDINVSWKGSMIMSELENAKKLGFVVSQKLIEKRGKNKISSYQQRIISALVAHDYDRVKEVLLSLSAYSGVEFAFFYKFLEDAEQYKDLAFAFASSLTVPSENKNK
ncbi:type I CRISPR-associated protein Cas8a1/Csx8 [Ruminococcus sp. LCP21S3_E8]